MCLDCTRVFPCNYNNNIVKFKLMYTLFNVYNMYTFVYILYTQYINVYKLIYTIENEF